MFYRECIRHPGGGYRVTLDPNHMAADCAGSKVKSQKRLFGTWGTRSSAPAVPADDVVSGVLVPGEAMAGDGEVVSLQRQVCPCGAAPRPGTGTPSEDHRVVPR